MILLRIVLLSLPLMMLYGCSASPPTRYYILDSVAAAQGGAAATAAPGSGPLVRLEPVVIPPELDRLELVTRSGPYRLRISDSERWAAPLDDQIRQVLSQDLAERLPPHFLADPNEPATSAPRRLLSIEISEFYSNGACSTTLRAEWTLRSPAGGSEHGSETVGPTSTAPCTAIGFEVPAAMSSALAALADRLTDVLKRLSSNTSKD
ncbi:MAG: PqiC family protein [Steroidobacteraceae bacterium]